MDIQTIWQNAIDKTQTSNLNYPLDNKAMSDINDVYHDFCNEVRKLNENYFYHRWYFDTIAYENKYFL